MCGIFSFNAMCEMKSTTSEENNKNNKMLQTELNFAFLSCLVLVITVMTN